MGPHPLDTWHHTTEAGGQVEGLVVAWAVAVMVAMEEAAMEVEMEAGVKVR
mgnify:CR=1 FL=1